jgi:peptidoglycan/xylan/chitin deacetylase (PgdA/CDA1 family)
MASDRMRHSLIRDFLIQHSLIRTPLRRAALRMLKACGAFYLTQASDWRRQRLLILCYHGVSLADEHEWRPYLYIRPEQLDRRLEILRKGKYSVLPLGEAIERLYRNDLPRRSVALTFDDGTYDFHRQAYPRIKQAGFPVTVYLTTYYSEHQLPVFSLICSYMMWRARGQGAVDLRELGVADPLDLGSPEQCGEAANRIVQWADGQDLTGEQKNQIAARLAQRLRIDYQEIVAQRILQLMNQQELTQLAEAGVDFQLHTHRHRMPLDEKLFRKEIRENRERIAQSTSGARRHFCYPSGAWRPEFLDWLKAEDVISATTCDTGIATPQSNRLLLPRLVDTTGRTDLEFESWVNGVGQFLSSGKRARLAYAPD